MEQEVSAIETKQIQKTITDADKKKKHVELTPVGERARTTERSRLARLGSKPSNQPPSLSLPPPP